MHMATQTPSDERRKVETPESSPHTESHPQRSHGSEGSSDSSQSEGTPFVRPRVAQTTAINSQRPVFSLALNKLQSAGAEGTSLDSPSAPQSTRRQLSSKLQKFVNFFERAAFTRAQSIDEVDLLAGGGGNEAVVKTVQTARAALGGTYSSLPSSTFASSAAIVPLSSRATTPIAADTPRSQSKLAPQRMGSVRDIIKRFDPDAGDVSARSLRRESSAASEFGSLIATPLKRASTLQPSTAVSSSPTVKWQQVEKKVEGKVVGKVWRKFEITADTPSISQSSPPVPADADGENNALNAPTSPSQDTSSILKEKSPLSPMSREHGDQPAAIGPLWAPSGPQSDALLMFDPIGEGDEENISEGSSSYSSDEDEDYGDDPANVGKLGRHGDSPVLGHTGGRGPSESREVAAGGGERRKKRRAGTNESGGTPTDDANKTKRASHFVAIRIDDPDVVDAVSRFQGELLHSAPFLDHCKSNVNKLHLTLLVLSLTPADIPRAKQAMQLGVQRFMKAKAGILEAHRAAGLRDELHGYESSAGRLYSMQAPRPSTNSQQENVSEAQNKDDSDAAFKLDFRTIGAFGTRVLFLSPPLRQRLLLQQFHVELARAFGEHGISIVGAGSGWNSAMEIQKQVRARSDEKVQHADLAPHRKSVDSTTASSVSNAANKLLAAAVAAGTDAKAPTSDGLPSNTAILPAQPLQQCSKPTATPQSPSQQRVYPESATPLDKMLLRQYDLSSARTALYIPQITLFKISKAAKRNKSKTPASTNMPKLKLFPRLYHNLVQRVLQSGLPAPRATQQSNLHREQILMTMPRSYEVYEAAEDNATQPSGGTTLRSQMTPAHWSLMSASSNLEASTGMQTMAGSISGEMRTGSGDRKRPITTSSLYAPPHYMSFSPGSFTPLIQRTPQPSAQSPVASPHYVTAPQLGGCAASPSTIVTSSNPQARPYQFFPTQAQTQFAYAQYFAATSPSHTHEAIIFAAQQAALQQQEVMRRYQQQESADGRTLYWPPPVCLPPTAPSQPSHMSDSYHSSIYNNSMHGGLQSPRHCNTSNERRSSSLNNTARQRLKLDKVITTSWAPNPPFGCQPCSFVELLEMSQMDPDGYYKRICRTMLTSNAELIDNLIFQPCRDDSHEETLAKVHSRHPSDERSPKQATVIPFEGQAVLSS